MAQFVDWDLAAATARTLGKGGPEIIADRGRRGRRRAAPAHRRGGRARHRLREADRRRSGTMPVRVVDRGDWAGINIDGLQNGHRPAGRPADRRAGSRARLSAHGRPAADRRAGRHGPGLPVRPRARPVRGVLLRPGRAAARRAEHRRGRAQARGRAARLPAVGLPARGHPPDAVHRACRGCVATSSSEVQAFADAVASQQASSSPTGCATALSALADSVRNPDSRASVLDLVQTPAQKADHRPAHRADDAAGGARRVRHGRRRAGGHPDRRRHPRASTSVATATTRSNG